jgi:hypothetical protein
MRRLATWMAALLLFATPQLAVAQHGGHGAGGMSGKSYPQDSDSALKDFQNTVAVEATEEQRSQFLSWSQNTEAVKLRLQELRPAVATNDFSSQLSALNAAIEKGNSGYHDFVGSLTKAQHEGLKKKIQKLGKTNDDLVKAGATAIRELGPANSGAKRTAKLAKVETAIDNLLSAQKAIAVEMGISA